MLATVFDPLRLLTTYAMGSSVDWDEPINENLSHRAARWFQELPAMVNIRIS